MEPATASVELTGDRLLLKCRAPIRILRMKVKPEFRLYKGFCLLTFEESKLPESGDSRPRSVNLKCPFEGIVSKVLISAGSTINNGAVILELKRCAHPIVMKDLCAECGADLRELDAADVGDASVSMIHAIPELRINEQLSQSIGKADEQRLLNQRKLVLLVDLDQTLVHTTSELIHPKLKNVEHFTLPGNRNIWYHTRIRPGTAHFLEKISRLFELHVVTFGARPYAHHIASLLDKEKKYFQFRILSRDECFHPASKKANLRSLFPCGDQIVAIIDDREDVWNFAPNLVTVKPYVFFRGAGDINAPIGGFAEYHSLPPSEGGLCSVYLNPRNPVVAQSDRDVVSCLLDVIEHTCVQVDGFVEYEDADDYLLYLEDILTTIHRAFFELYEQMQSKAGSSDSNSASGQVGNGSSGGGGRSSRIPDLKTVIPYVKQKVLKDVIIVFTGCLPTNLRPETAKIYQVAVSLGARVHKDISKEVTHVVAARAGTAKLAHARKFRTIKVVSTQWLWCCAERWEHVPEKLFPLKDMGPEDTVSGRRRNKLGRPTEPPLSPEERQQVEQEAREMLELNRLAGEQQALLPEALVPSLAIGMEGLAEMGKEVEDELDDDDEDDENGNDENEHESDLIRPSKRRRHNSGSSDEEDALYGEDNSAPRGWKGTDGEVVEEEDFGGRTIRGDMGREEWEDSDGESIGEVDDEMAAAVERELFS